MAADAARPTGRDVGGGRWWRSTTPLAWLAVAAGALAPSLWVRAATDATFTAATATPSSWTAGSVVLTDDDANQALFSVSGLIPGQSVSRCLTVSYGGTLPAQVRLSGTSGGTGLAAYLDLEVTRGTFSGAAAPDCTGFVPDLGIYLGTGHDPGVVVDEPLTSLAGTWAAGTADPDGTAAGTWLPGETHVYRFTLIERADDAAAGLSATAAFVVTARDADPPELDAGQTLHNGASMRSAAGAYHLDVQRDGNVVVYPASGGAVWSSGTWSQGPAVDLRLRPDGDLVAEKPGAGVVWESGTTGSGADHLVLRDDGVLELRRADGTTAWTSGP